LNTSTGAGRIPVLDVAPYLAGAPGAATRLADAVESTCADTGFLVISNHGVPQDLIDRAFASAAGFFSLSETEKLGLKIEDRNIGYLPYGGQTMRTSTIQVATKPNYSESFYITDPEPDPSIQDVAEDLNKWPPGMAAFKTTQIEYFRAMRRLARRFLPVFALVLDLPDDYFDDDFRGANCTVRLIQYAPQPIDEADLFGFAPHTDGSFITFLPRSEFPGLEVQSKDGSWIQPPDVPGAFVVNTGEMLSRYSNDRFVPTPHRVINRSSRTRHAMPFFFGPNRNTVVHCAPTCVDDQHPPKYAPMSSAQLNAVKDKTNFPHRHASSR
jgi:isopenicillin N synthase-like dioxygenase